MGVRVHVVTNPKVTPEILSSLSDDFKVQVRKEVASHALTPLETLKKLADDNDEVVSTAARTNDTYITSPKW